MLDYNKGISKIDIIAVMLYIAVFKFSVGPQIIQQVVKALFIAIILGFLFLRMSRRKLANCVTLLAVSFILSGLIGVIHGNLSLKSTLDGILYAVCIFCMYGVIREFAETDQIWRFIDISFVMTGVYCAISVISIFHLGVSTSGTEMEYFFGNKFSTSYYFILLAGLYYVKYFKIRNSRGMRVVFFLLALLSFVISYWVKCSTAVIGTAIMVLCVIIPDSVKLWLQNRKLMIILICIMGAFPFYVTAFLENPRVEYLIVELLGESMSLTGRLAIYKCLPSIIAAKPIFGYGYNNWVITEQLGYGNAQNGLMEIAVNFGLAGMICFLNVVYRSVSIEDDLKNYGLYAVLYALTICSTVEVSFNYFFYVTLFIILFNSLTTEEESNNEQKEVFGQEYGIICD